MALLLDAGPIYSSLDESDADHASCRQLLAQHPDPLRVPVLVVAEVAYLVRRWVGVETQLRFLGDLARGVLSVEKVHARDWLRIAELVAQYRDLRLSAVDASIIAAAERLGITTIATLDHRDFRPVRPRHAPAFELLP